MQEIDATQIYLVKDSGRLRNKTKLNRETKKQKIKVRTYKMPLLAR